MSVDTISDLDQLIHVYLDGRINSQEMERLNEHLRRDRLARQEFANYLTLDSALADIAAGLPGQRAAVEDIVELNQRALISTSFAYISLLSTVAAVAMLILWWSTDSYRSYATVVRSVGAPSLVDGMSVRDELNVIRTGLVEFVTARGARVVIEAPAEFFFESALKLNMRAGRLTADVPASAIGFTVVTPSGEAIDLGTKFAVDITSQTQAEVHVFEGEVIARSRGSDRRQHLTASSAVRMGRDATTQACDVRQGAFVGNREMASMAEALAAGQKTRAKQAREKFQRDPKLLAWLDFDRPGESQPAEYDAQVVGAQWVQGRFPGTGAIDFIEPDDCVTLNLNTHTDQFTLMTWARLNQFEERANSLYSTDEWGELGQVHWLIGDKTNLRFAIKGTKLTATGDTNVWLESQPRALPELERWVHLALVYDAQCGKAIQYLNGQQIAVADMPLGLQAALGPAQLGNWKPQLDRQRNPKRRLSGRMDEFVAFARGLSASEISDYFAASTPYK